MMRRSLVPRLLAIAFATVLLAAACHDWDAYDPRLTGSTGSGGGTASSSVTTTASTTTDTSASTTTSTTASSGAGGAGGGDAGPTYREIVEADGPVAYFRFEDQPGAMIADDLGPHTGVPSDAGLTYAVKGRVGNAMKFDGQTGFIQLLESQDLAFLGTSPYTFEAWIKPAAKIDPYPHILGKEWVQSGGHYGFEMLGGVGNDGGVVCDNARLLDGGALGTAAVAVGVLAVGSWTHVVGTFDGGTLAIYLNTVLISETATFDAGIADNDAGMFLGWAGINKFGHFAGVMDELAIYDKVLTVAQIKAHHSAGLAGL